MRKKLRWRTQTTSEPERPRMEGFIDLASRLHEAGRLNEAIAVLEAAPAHMQRRPELLVLRGMIFMEAGNTSEAMESLEEAGQVAPHLSIPFALLSIIYFDQGWLSHALRMIRKAHDLGVPDPLAAEMEQLTRDVEVAITEEAETLGVTFKRMEEALHVMEQAERLMNEEEYRQAARYYHRTSELLPKWTEPRSFEAISLFLAGMEAEAIRLAGSVLEQEPNNIQALTSLVIFHASRDEMDKARAFAERVRPLPLKNPKDLEMVIQAFGFLNEDATLVALCTSHQRYLRDLSPALIIILGSAAANQGDAKLARRLWNRARRAGFPEEIIALYREALEDEKPGPGIASRYPTRHPVWLISPRQIQELVELGSSLMSAGKEERKANVRRLRRRINEIATRTPRLVQAATWLLWEQPLPETGLTLLGTIGTPEAIAEIERLAFSQAGSLDLRLQAVDLLIDLDALDPHRPVSLWDEEVGEWRRMRPKWEIISAHAPPPLPPEVSPLLDESLEALRRQQWDVAVEKCQAALAINPNLAGAHRDLAFALDKQGDRSAAIAHLKRALEIDPDHVHARCTLALYYLSEEPQDIPAAQALLEPVLERPALTEDEIVYYHCALSELAIARERYNEAREYLDTALKIAPDNMTVQEQRKRLWDLEMAHSPQWAELREYQRRKREEKRRLPIHQKATLKECLARITKSALLITAKHTPIPQPYKMHKAKLTEAIATQLLQPAVLGPIVGGLSETERQALQDVLENGGMLPWEEFVGRYGDDLDESEYWNWHPPETTMGRLRMFGLLSSGTVNEQFVVLVPIELRNLLPPLLHSTASKDAA